MKLTKRTPRPARIVAGRVDRGHGRAGAGRTPGTSLVERLLGSSTRVRLLAVLLTNPNQEFYLRELQRRIGASPRAVHHELANLEWMGLVTSRRQGRIKFFQADPKHPIYQELKQIIYKTVGLGDALREALAEVPGIEAAFIYGSVAKGTERGASDLDLMIIGEPDQEQVDRVLRETESTLGREINLTIMTLEEWRSRRAAGDTFVAELGKSKKIMLIGHERSLRSA